MTTRTHLLDSELKQAVLSLGIYVERSLDVSVESLVQNNFCAFYDVQKTRNAMKQWRIKVEQISVEKISRHKDLNQLRAWMAVVKLNANFERIGLQNLELLQSVRELLLLPPLAEEKDFHQIARDTQRMLRGVLEALTHEDLFHAYNVIVFEDIVVSMTHRLTGEIKGSLQREAFTRDADKVSSYIQLLLILSGIEKISRHCVHVAYCLIWAMGGHSPERGFEEFDLGQSRLPLDPL